MAADGINVVPLAVAQGEPTARRLISLTMELTLPSCAYRKFLPNCIGGLAATVADIAGRVAEGS
jgi:hypothetical protein